MSFACVFSVSVLFLVTILEYKIKAYGVVNLALRKPTRQSTTYAPPWFRYVSDLAVDGDTNSNFAARSCSNTRTYRNQWFEVDLRGYYVISDVILVNRLHCCSKHLRDFVIETFIEDRIEYPALRPRACATYPLTVPRGATVTVRCAPATVGRFVQIRLTGDPRPLALCEVMVHGSEVSTIGITSSFHGSVNTVWTPATIVEGNVTSRVDCSAICHRSALCMGFNYNTAIQQCQLASPIGSTTAVGAQSWIYYRRIALNYTEPCSSK